VAAKPLRADARRNRDRLIEVAAKAFASSGVGASLEAIAREAGVGPGTLYRHFPAREVLIEAVYRREVEGLVAAAEELARTSEPDEALAEWMQRFVGYMATKRGMRDSLRLLLESNSPLFAQTSGAVPLAFKLLMERARALEHLLCVGRTGLAGSLQEARPPHHGWPSLWSFANIEIS
jgi:AcrR family transcriptional regulator